MDGHDKKIWAVCSSGGLPYRMGPLTSDQEGRIVVTLIGELKQNLALELDPTPKGSRSISSRGELGAAAYLVVGSSNAKWLAEALKAKGIATGSVLCSNWRATKKSAEDMATLVKEELAANFYSAVVYLLLDNNVYFSKFEDGSLCPARKAIDGKYHVDGELVVAARDTLFFILKLCAPLWEAAKGRHMVVVGPLPRYVKFGCCQEDDHITNRADPDYYPKMKKDLAVCSSVIKDFLFTSGNRNRRHMDPARTLSGLAAAEIWGTDPIHPKPEAEKYTTSWQTG